MIPIYIHAFNRPFYLDRCIQSIETFVTGYSRIIILDGGTPDKYNKKIKSLYPSVEIIVSDKEPYNFWISETEKERSNYICVVQDDTWFTDAVDLEMVVSRMKQKNLPLVKLVYGTEFEKGIDTELIDYVEVYAPNFNRHPWQAWISCMGVYLKEYWMVGFKAVTKTFDENPMIEATTKYVQEKKLNIGRMPFRSMRQGQGISSRPDAIAKYKAQKTYLNALNELWYEDKMDALENFPKDFSVEYLIGLFKAQNVSDEEIEVWKKQRTSLRDEVDFLI